MTADMIGLSSLQEVNLLLLALIARS